MNRDLINLIKQAGEETLKHFRLDSLEVQKKGAGMNDILTIADENSHKILTAGLQELGANQILSEESALHETFDWTGEVRIIDPIDGTRLFVRGNDGYSILMSQCVDGEIVQALAMYPALDEIIYAKKGEGCWRILGDDLPERFSLVDNLDNYSSCIVRVWPERSLEEDDIIVIKNFLKKEELTQQDVVFGRETREFLLGNIDFFIESYPTLGKWDISPSALFVKEVGGFMCDIYGNNIDFTTSHSTYSTPIMVGNKSLKEMLLDKLNT